ncbi:MAG: RHS repeat-associated core domain-containing protein [Armatimonadetes bacterium]|nr:RHS repeat-associated core domain-containing protein [Armatimonadota bacterium]
MRNPSTPKWIRPASFLVTFLMVNLYVPYAAVGKVVADEAARERKAKNAPRSRLLTAEELRGYKGKTVGNPYQSGGMKWDPVIKGVNLRTGDFSMSATDMSFEGGYGVPVSVSRTYSSNCLDDSGFGTGWSSSFDLRSAAGSMLKSPGAPRRSTPVSFHMRNSAQANTNSDFAPKEPLYAAISIDASGETETVQRDVDGILTNPAWDRNLNECTWGLNSSGVMELQQVVTTAPEGTVYTYTNVGYYDGGVQPWNGEGDAEASPVLKCTSIKDRHGNETTLTYSSTTASFTKSDGVTVEKKLDHIDMPAGRRLQLSWTTAGPSSAPRVSQVEYYTVSGGTGTATGKKVQYAYDSDGNLSKVTSPGGKDVDFAYDWPYWETGGQYTDAGSRKLLASINDVQGRTTSLKYVYKGSTTNQWRHLVGVFKVSEPNGVDTWFNRVWLVVPSGFSMPSDWVGFESDTMTWGMATTAGTRLWQGFFRYDLDSGHINWSCNPDVHGGRTGWIKSYDIDTQDMLSETRFFVGTDQSTKTGTNLNSNCQIDKATVYNFMHNPLSQTVVEHRLVGSGPTHLSRTFVTEYAYWPKNKYYQQKAVRTDLSGGAGTSWRYSYTSYHDDGYDESGAGTSTSDGDKGQTYKVYDAKYGGVSLASGSSDWRERVQATGTNAAEFHYDSVGRPDWVKKLAPDGSSYVQTTTSYSGPHGEASSVTEDNGGINRTTTTDQWSWTGKAQRTTDAAGREFTTAWWSDDGEVDTVTKTGTSTAIVDYDYGSLRSGTSPYPKLVEAGQVTQVIDGIGSVKDQFYYVQSGGAAGAVDHIAESSTTLSLSAITNTVTYGYDSIGRKASAHYSTPNGYSKWAYKNYFMVGFGDAPQMRFGAMNRQTSVTSSASSGSDSAEELWYYYDDTGRLYRSFFGMTRRSGYSSGGYTDPASTASGDQTNKPANFCEALYDYDAAGRTNTVAYTWWSGYEDTGGAYNKWLYTQHNKKRYSADYDAYLGLKTGVHEEDGSSTSWTEDTSKAQEYQYEAERDFLKKATYHDGGTSPYYWAYDAAGNRYDSNSSWSTLSNYTFDNLNRMTASSGSHTYLNDQDTNTSTDKKVGNRTWRDWGNTSVAVKYAWDDLNRLKACQNFDTGATYRYRADGLRVSKIEGITLAVTWVYDDSDPETPIFSGYHDNISSNRPTTRYYHDGQMVCEEDYTHLSGGSAVKDVTKYGIGPRGVDLQAYTPAGGSESVGYALYDTHGNSVCSIDNTGTLGPQRTYDAWGAVRTSSSALAKDGERYCAALGHNQDDETGTYTSGNPNGDGLVYMRAREYEPSTGRFLSEDSACHGGNWYAYANNCPTNLVDASGNEETVSGQTFSMSIWATWGGYMVRASCWVTSNIGLRIFTLAIGFIQRANEAVRGNIPALIREVEELARSRGCQVASLNWSATTEDGSRFVVRLIEYMSNNLPGFTIDQSGPITYVYWLLQS